MTGVAAAGARSRKSRKLSDLSAPDSRERIRLLRGRSSSGSHAQCEHGCRSRVCRRSPAAMISAPAAGRIRIVCRYGILPKDRALARSPAKRRTTAPTGSKTPSASIQPYAIACSAERQETQRTKPLHLAIEAQPKRQGKQLCPASVRYRDRPCEERTKRGPPRQFCCLSPRVVNDLVDHERPNTRAEVMSIPRTNANSAPGIAVASQAPPKRGNERVFGSVQNQRWHTQMTQPREATARGDHGRKLAGKTRGLTPRSNCCPAIFGQMMIRACCEWYCRWL